jgi:hypothetical protein
VRGAFRTVSTALALILAGCAPTAKREAVKPEAVKPPDAARLEVQVLNRLRDEVNAAYGFRGGTPRINLGPCGRFARDFRERWNARFRDRPAHIIFVMADDGSQCHHVLVRLPDGNGVTTVAALLALYPQSHIDDMTEFDPTLLDRRSYGLGRSYPECPNYSDDLTRRLVDHYLGMLPVSD